MCVAILSLRFVTRAPMHPCTHLPLLKEKTDETIGKNNNNDKQQINSLSLAFSRTNSNKEKKEIKTQSGKFFQRNWVFVRKFFCLLFVVIVVVTNDSIKLHFWEKLFLTVIFLGLHSIKRVCLFFFSPSLSFLLLLFW